MIGGLGLGVTRGEAAGLLRLVAKDGGSATGLSGSSGRSEAKLEVTEVEMELLVLLLARMGARKSLVVFKMEETSFGEACGERKE